MKQPTQNWVLQKFNKLQKRLLRSITQGTFLKLATDKQLQLTRRVYNYASTVKRAIKPAIVSAFVAVGFATTANGQIVFTEQTGLANPLDTVNATAPKSTFVDIDDDGDMDAFIGAPGTGKIAYYKNTGTASSANFTRQIGAADPLDTVTVYYAAPTLEDIDNDGDKDLFVGTYSGSIHYFRNIGTATSPAFAEQFAASNPFDTVDVGYQSVPTFVDIDNDGDKDAFIGGFGGKIKYFRNTGTATSPIFAEQFAANNPFDTVDVLKTAVPAFVDLDKDGDMDAFIGSYYGEVHYFRNIGTATAPIFAEQFGASNPLDSINSTLYAIPSFVDIDDDGDMDVFIGAYSGGTHYVLYFRNDSPVSTYQLPTIAPKTLVIYPNPTKGILSFEQNLTGLATIYNSLGQSVRALQLNGQNQLSAEGLPVGNYLLRIMTEDGELQLAKFMIKE